MNRPALRYHGGKWKLAPWIIQQFPPHTCYVEPFGGGANVLLRKQPAFIEVYNDLNGLAVNFFRVLRERPDDFMRLIELTPYSRQEFTEAQEPTDDPLEQARRFFVWSWQGRGRAGVKEPGGWRFMSRDTRGRTPVHDWVNNHHLWEIVQRLRMVQIENADALTVIARYDGPDTLHYIDPPYVQDTRGTRWARAAYACEYSDEQHRELAHLLHEVIGTVVLSGYPSTLYDELYSDWRKIEKPGQKDNAPRRDTTECLWISRETNQRALF
jgi:DNA adenine methylase